MRLILLAVLALLGCQRDRASTGTAKNPFVLVVSPAHATPDVASELERALAEASGLTVRVRLAEGGADAVAAAGLQSADAGLLPVFEYLLARQEFGVEARLQSLRDGAREYAGVIVVAESSPVRTLAELAGKRIAYVEPTSTTGYLLALRALGDVRVTSSFAGSHDAAVEQVRAGAVEAAATYAAPRAGLRVVAETGAVPNEPVFFSPKVPVAVREKIERAFGALDPALLGRLAGISGFAPTTDEAYRPVHDLLRDTARSAPDLVPGGRHLVEWRSVPASELGAI